MSQEQMKPEAIPNKDSILKKLQGLSRDERLVLFELAKNIGATTGGNAEVFINAITQFPIGDLRKLDEAWNRVNRYAADRGMAVQDLSSEDLSEAFGEAAV